MFRELAEPLEPYTTNHRRKTQPRNVITIRKTEQKVRHPAKQTMTRQ